MAHAAHTAAHGHDTHTTGHEVGHGVTDMGQEVLNDVVKDALKDTHYPWSARLAKALKIIPGGKYTAKVVARAFTGTASHKIVALLGLEGTERRVVLELLENAATGPIFGIIEHASEMSEEEVASAFKHAAEAKAAADHGRSEHGLETAIVAIKPAVLAGKVAHRPKISGGKIVRDSNGLELSACGVYIDTVYRPFVEANLVPETKQVGGGKDKQPRTVQTGKMVLRRSLENLTFTDDEFVEAVNRGEIEPCPTCHPTQYRDFAEGRAVRAERAKPVEHHEHHETAEEKAARVARSRVEFMKQLAGKNPRLHAILVALVEADPGFFERALRNDILGDLTMWGMAEETLAEKVRQLEARGEIRWVSAEEYKEMAEAPSWFAQAAGAVWGAFASGVKNVWTRATTRKPKPPSNNPTDTTNQPPAQGGGTNV